MDNDNHLTENEQKNAPYTPPAAGVPYTTPPAAGTPYIAPATLASPYAPPVFGAGYTPPVQKPPYTPPAPGVSYAPPAPAAPYAAPYTSPYAPPAASPYPQPTQQGGYPPYPFTPVRQPVYPAYPQPPYFLPQSIPGKGYCTAGLILGICSIVLICLWPVTGIAALVGIIMSSIGLSRVKRIGAQNGTALAGLILSIVGLLIFIAVMVYLIYLAVTGAGFEDMYPYYYEQT